MNEQLTKLIKRPGFVPGVVGAVSFGCGLGLGYFLGKRRKKVEIHALPEQMKLQLDVAELVESKGYEIEEVVIEEETVEVYEQGDDIATPAEAFILQHLPDTVVLDTEPEERRLVFAPDTEDWNYEAEVAARTTTEPYVLHKDEFYAEERGYSQSTYTYYAGDDIMVDQEDQPVYNYMQVVGQLLFGHGSEDPNVFHVRNDSRKAEYEVIYDPGQYAIEILGLDSETSQRIRDPNHMGPPKMRPE